MLKLLPLDTPLTNIIKVLSTILITAAVGLELGNLTTRFISDGSLASLQIVWWIGRIALVAHALEGVIAAFYAPSRQQSPLRYSLYIFFVGTIGLVELLQLPRVTK
jgi:hypothetical protein